MYKQLTSEQRYTICSLLQRKCSLSFIAETIKVSVSTVSREIKRNSKNNGQYLYHLAVLRTKRRKAKNPGNRSIPPHIRSKVFELIRKEQWSPEQISGRLKKTKEAFVSKSTIYNWIAKCSPHYKDSIHKYLRRKGKKVKCKNKNNNAIIFDRVSIEQRPLEANANNFGHWEMDTIVGKNGKGVIVTLVEKKSSFMLMKKLQTGKMAIPLANIIVKLLKNCGLPIHTITTDNGLEFAAHKIIAKKLNTKIYFTHPYSSWEKGAIENINGLIRQYIPKKADFRGFSDKYIEWIMEKLNNRPRKKNKFIKPKEMIKEYKL